MAQPNDGDIDIIISITGFTDRPLIAAALKAKNNSLDQVVNEILDDRTKFITTYGWDDKAFSAPREGTPNSQVPSFAIHAADDGPVLQGVEPNYYQGQAGAPSRPPSRTNNRSPLSRLVDYNADNTTGETAYQGLDGVLSNQHAGGNIVLPTSIEQEDAELQQAIAASVATSNMHSPQPQPQESGVADADTGQPHFGPANRTDYNTNEWAMITLNHDKPEPDPSRRKREAGVPAFLRCRTENAWEKHRVGGLLTILHSIPAARNALLRYGPPPPQSYGHDPEWWKGKAIVPPAAQAEYGAGEMTWSDEPKPRWSDELHRLMAFLDMTDRSYGTADVLADSAPEGQPSSTDSERDFFWFLLADAGAAEQVKPLITTCHLASVHDDETPYTRSDRFAILDLSLSKEQLSTVESVYGLWDSMFQRDYRSYDGDETGTEFPLLTELGEVLTMRITGDDGLQRPIEIPKTFYLDRYVASNRAEIAKILREARALDKAIIRAEKAVKRLTTVVDPANNKDLSRIDLNKGSIERMREKRAFIKQWALWRMHQEENERTGAEPHMLLQSDTPDDKISWTDDETKVLEFLDAKVLQLEDELTRVEEEIGEIHRERDRVIEASRELEKRLIVPDENTGYTPQFGYTLRGIVSSSDVLYLCCPAEQDLMQIDEVDSNTKAGEQWWKLGYVAADDEPIKAEVTTFEKVVEEACGMGSKPILIYASPTATAEEPAPLSDALQTFVRFDNHLFKKELAEEAPRDKKRGGFTSPASPSKRLNRSNSLDSMATNAASAGDLDDDMRDAPYEPEDDPFSIGDGANDMGPPLELIDTSVPESSAPTQIYQQDEPSLPPETQSASAELNGYHTTPAEASSSSPTTSVRQLANISLDEMVSRGLDKTNNPPPSNPVPRPGKTFPIAPGPPRRQTSTNSDTKVPEMQERGGATSPFLLQGAAAASKSPASLDMELDDERIHEGGHGDDQ